MLIEDCIIEFELLFNALELMNDYINTEMDFKLYPVSHELYDKLKSFNIINKNLINELQNKKQKIIKELEQNYKILLQNEP